MKKALVLFLKLALFSGLLAFLASKGLLSFEATRSAFLQRETMALAVLAIAVSTLLGPLRWQWLLRAQGIELPFGQTLRLSLVGSFFNVALPGAVSGDFVKAFYVAREAPGVRAKAFGSILFDRVVGLSALLIVAACALTLDLEVLAGSPLLRVIRVPVSLGALGFIAFYAYLFGVRPEHDLLLRLLEKLRDRFQAFGALERTYLGVRTYREHRWVVARSLAVSILIQLLMSTACFLFAVALGDSTLSPLSVFVVVPLGLLVTAIPVFPAGVGTGHAAFAFLFGFLGSQRGGDVFSLNALMAFAIGAVGGLVYLRTRGNGPGPIPTEPA